MLTGVVAVGTFRGVADPAEIVPGDGPCCEGYAAMGANGELPRAPWKSSGENEAATEVGRDWKGEPGPPGWGERPGPDRLDKLPGSDPPGVVCWRNEAGGEDRLAKDPTDDVEGGTDG